MKRGTNKTMIGAFVVGAVVLLVVAVMILGGGRILTPKDKWVLYFRGSVKGLQVGAPVMFRGVRIGSVTNIKLMYNTKDLTTQIPVTIETQPHRWTAFGEEADLALEADDPQGFKRRLIDRGLRASLQLQSLLTGQYMVNLDFRPDDTEPRLIGIDNTYPEVPTIRSGIDEWQAKIEKLPLDEMVGKLTLALAGIERKVNSPELTESITTLNEALKDIRKMIQNIDSRVEPLTTGIQKAVADYGKLARNLDGRVGPLAADLDETLKDTRELVRNVDKRIEPLISDLQQALKTAEGALEQGKDTLAAVEKLVAEDAPVVYELKNTLRQLSAAARSIRIWADYLERNPDALLRGKRR
jgi:paraquat-inducible protein B